MPSGVRVQMQFVLIGVTELIRLLGLTLFFFFKANQRKLKKKHHSICDTTCIQLKGLSKIRHTGDVVAYNKPEEYHVIHILDWQQTV